MRAKNWYNNLDNFLIEKEDIYDESKKDVQPFHDQ